jgi:hypothetical protein
VTLQVFPQGSIRLEHQLKVRAGLLPCHQEAPQFLAHSIIAIVEYYRADRLKMLDARHRH